jgi:hypothetical protein
MKDFIIRIVVSFVVRQILKFGRDTNWQMIKDDLALRIRALIPGSFFDSEAVAMMEFFVDIISGCLSSESNWVKILTLLAEQKYAEAVDILIGWIKNEIGI